MERKLASIQRIKSLDPIPDAEFILKATVLGWELVVKKDEFQVGDACVYIEIDSLMPERPEFDFLKSSNMRIRTARMRGQISQGICFPLSILGGNQDLADGTDVTEMLGIKKYEPVIPACLEGDVEGAFPVFVPKTDEPRIQTCEDMIHRNVALPCYISEKLDGSSVTYFYNEGKFGVCGRNWEFKPSDKNSLWQYAVKNDLETKMASLGWDVVLQGEIIGHGIQNNKYGIKGRDVYFFNAFNIKEYRYLDFLEFLDVINKLGLKNAPVLDSYFDLHWYEHDHTTDNWVPKTTPQFVGKAIGKSVLNDKVHREGIVIRPLKETQDSAHSRFSFKVINPEFLLKHKE